MTLCLLLTASSAVQIFDEAAAAPSDAVASLPTYGALHQKQYAGFAPVAPGNKLHYWFVEREEAVIRRERQRFSVTEDEEARTPMLMTH